MTRASSHRAFAIRGRRPRPRRRAFTLVELVLSVTISTLLLGGIASAMLIANRAVPDRQQKVYDIVKGHEVLSGVTHELYTLLTVTDAKSNAVAFTVPDRTGDFLAESIAYAWSGTAGHPLTRRYNGGSVVNVLEDVYAFDITYVTKAVTVEGPLQPVEGPEQVLKAHLTPVSAQTVALTSTVWVGQYFKPTFLLLPTPTAWRITRVRLMLSKDGATDGQFLLQLRRPNADTTPSSTVLAQVTVNESAISGTLTLTPFTFASAPAILPSDGVCIVLQHVSGAASARVQYDQGPVSASHSARLSYSSGAWAARSTEALVYEASAAVTTEQPSEQTTEYLMSVGLSAQAGADASARMWTGVTIVNLPQIVPP